MQTFLINQFLQLRKRTFIQITQKTLVSLFPFLLFVTILLVFSQSVFSDGGFVNSLFGVSGWFPYFNLISRALANFIHITGGLTAPLVTYFAAKYTAGAYGRSTGTAGITALIFSLLINSRELFSVNLNDGVLTRVNLPVNFNMFIAVLLGYVVGQIFRLSNPLDDEIVDEHYIYRPKTVRPIALSLLLAVAINGLFILGNQYNVFSTIDTWVGNLFFSSRGVFQVSVNTIMRSLGAWIGNSSPYNEIGFFNDGDALTNLNAALSAGSTSKVPYLFTDTNLYAAYGALGGIGGTLALTVAILLKTKSQKNQSVALRGLFPTLFNHGISVMVGIPIFFNVLYLIPFILVPVVNVLLAALALGLKLVPPAVYPVPSGTPNILYAFIGTAGSLRALALSLTLFVLDVLIFIPFVTFDNRLHDQIQKEGGSHDSEN